MYHILLFRSFPRFLEKLWQGHILSYPLVKALSPSFLSEILSLLEVPQIFTFWKNCNVDTYFPFIQENVKRSGPQLF